jgi:hypothetical protein
VSRSIRRRVARRTSPIATVRRIELFLKSCQAARQSSGQLRSRARPGKPVQPGSLLTMSTRTPTARARTTVTSPWRPPLEVKPKQRLAATPASSHHGQLPMQSTVLDGVQEALPVGPVSLNRRSRRRVSNDLNRKPEAKRAPRPQPSRAPRLHRLHLNSLRRVPCRCGTRRRRRTRSNRF